MRDPVVILQGAADLVPDTSAAALLARLADDIANGKIATFTARSSLLAMARAQSLYGDDGCAALRIAYEELAR